MSRVFFDTNTLLYAFDNDRRATVARLLLEAGGGISTQNLNEFTSVARRKLGFGWPEIKSSVETIVMLCGAPLIVDYDLHQKGRLLAEQYHLSFYDAMIVAAALTADCDILYSEDMHAGLVIDGRLTIVNPFVAG